MKDVEALSRQGSVAGLVKQLASEDGDVRDAAAEALVAIGEVAVQPLLETVHHSPDSGAREAAASALATLARNGMLGGAVVEPLIEILRDGSWWERLCAASALGYVGDPRAVEPLIEAMRHGEVVSLRETAQEALGRIDDQRAKRALSDDHPESE